MLKDPSLSFTHPSLLFLSQYQQDRWASEGVKDFSAFIEKLWSKDMSAEFDSYLGTTLNKSSNIICD